nr:hypothetical protein [Tanacetum cinerariifolium]
MKIKVKGQPWKVNKKNHVVETIHDVDVKHSLLNANSICATCKKSMFDGVHDTCYLDFVKNMNSCAKSAKKHKKIFGNLRVMITSAKIVPPKKTTSHSVETQKLELKVYSWKPKNVKNVGYPDCSLESGLWMFETYDREPLLAHELILRHIGDNTYLTDVNVDYLHQPWRSFATVINKCLSGKETGIDKIHLHEKNKVYGTILPKELTNQVMLESKAYQTYYAFASGEKAPKLKYVRKKVDPDTSTKQKPVRATKGTRIKTKSKVAKSDKKKQPAKKPKAKGLAVLSEVLGEQQQKTFGADEGSEDDDEDDFEDDVDNNDDESDDNGCSEDHNDDSDDEKTESDSDEILDPNKSNEEHDKEKEEYDDEFNVEEGNKDADMTDADQGRADQQNASQQLKFENEEEDAHVTLTHVLDIQKTEGPTQSSYVSSDFTNVATPAVEKNVTESLEATVLTRSSSQPQFSYEAVATLSEFELTKILIDKMQKNKSFYIVDYKRDLYDALLKSYNSEKDIFESYGEVFSLKRSQDKRDKDRDLSAISDRGTKRRKSSKDAESSKDSKSKEKKSLSTSKDDSQSQHKSSSKSAYTWISQVARVKKPPTLFDELNDTSFDFSAFFMNQLKILNLTLAILVGPAFNLLKGTCKSTTELEYHLEECSRATTERLDWHNLENKSRRIITVTRLKIMKKYDYGHLEEIEVHRDDQKLYTFKEGDFKRLHLQDIEDMLLLLVQQRLTKLTINKRYDLNVALRMYTRRIVIQRRVEDLQLGVESYQKKLNLTKPDTCSSNLMNKTAYTSYSDPHGIIYMDQYRRKRLMRTDELHKFSDGTLNDVRSALYDIAAGIRMEYLPMRKWSNLDKKWV